MAATPILGGVIETERLLLRPLRMADVDTFVALHADPRVNHFVGSYSREQARDRLATIERQWAERGHGLCEDRFQGHPVTVFAVNRPSGSPTR